MTNEQNSSRRRVAKRDMQPTVAKPRVRTSAAPSAPRRDRTAEVTVQPRPAKRRKPRPAAPQPPEAVAVHWQGVPFPAEPTPPATPPLSPRLPIGTRFVGSVRNTLTSWQFWLLIGSSSVLGVGWLSAALLFKLPSLPNCPSIFWPTASASLRMYCAQLAANKQTVDDLLEAITLVNSLPETHAMRTEIDRSIEQWSEDILALADDAFHRGDLQGAIAIAQRIPANTSAHSQVEQRISQWRDVWEKAEAIYDEAESALFNDQNPRKAFDLGVQLVTIGNRYWETTKYRELQDLITASRQDGNRLAQIRRLARRGGLNNLLEAIEMARQIKSTSPTYPAVQRLLDSLGRDLIKLAEEALQQRDLDEALAIVGKIPDVPTLRNDIQDFKTLAQARAQTWEGSAADLESAIIQAQRIRSDRALYGKAQEWISRWQREIQDVTTLDRARNIAALGTLGDLRSAIAEARTVPLRNPRGNEAQDLIREWTTEIETTEDRPILLQADAYASAGDLNSAIAVARQIRSGRALHGEAQSRIRGWTNQVQRAQDQPVLERARQLASAGNLPDAIATAEQIGSGRVLHDDAQAELRTWRAQVEGQQRMQQAYTAASAGTTTALLDAIRLASQVPAGTSSRADADRMIGNWSQSLLQAAETQAGVDLAGAIALAELIPPNTAAYSQAQAQLSTWRQLQQQTLAPTPDYSIEGTIPDAVE
ncbi:hypothetical protein ACQ4M4_19090 [Leptolyngbya sp. AN02str]|uniref:hypothetical protein n=1 Tax=Leptolyngbya sp. AN02str TaxID=3423363 RepID=UPI003D31DCC2